VGRKILITGASGTVGSAAGKYLCKKGFEVVGVSRNIGKESDCFTETEPVDLLTRGGMETFRRLLADVDVVLHLAWNLSEENFDTGTSWAGNMEMYRNVLGASGEADVGIFINGSSIHAGTGGIPALTVEASLDDTPEPYRSSLDPEEEFDLRRDEPEKLLSPLEEDPDSPYGESKVRTEKMLREAVNEGRFVMGVSIRIGGLNEDNKQEKDGEPFYHTVYWSHRDVGRTLENILEADLKEKGGYHQFYGVSDNEGRIFSIENSFTGKTDGSN